MSDHLKPIVEALIFASPEPLTPKALYRLLDGEPVAYLGPLVKRRAPTEEDYLVLQPGETVSGSLDLRASGKPIGHHLLANGLLVALATALAFIISPA